MKAIAYLLLSYLLAALLYRYQVEEYPFWACAIAGLAIGAMVWGGVWWLKTGGKIR